MKLNKIWASLLGMLALTACSNEADTLETPGTPSSDKPKTERVQVDLSAGTDENTLRMNYNIGTDGGTAGLAMPEKDLNIYLVVRRSDNPDLAYTQVVFKKTAGLAHARYTGQINIPAAPSTGAEASPTYEIAAILLSEVGKEASPVATIDPANPAKVNFVRTPGILKATEAGGKKTLDINVPYVANWTTLTVPAAGGAVNPVSLLFGPKGTLLRMKVKNMATAEVKLDRLYISSTAFLPNGAMVFSKTGAPTWAADGLSAMHGASYALPEVLTLPAIQSGVPGTSDWYYIWMMPTTFVEPVTTIGLVREGLDLAVLADQQQVVRGFKSSKRLPEGVVPITLVFSPSETSGSFSDFINHPEDVFTDEGTAPTRPKMALEYVAERNLTQAGNAFVTADAESPGYFSWADAQTQFGQGKVITIEGKNYHLPSSAEWLGVFGAWKYVFYEEYHSYSNVPEVIEVAGVYGAYTADYRNVRTQTEGMTYALRFKSPDNKMLVAYRYRRIGDFQRETTWTGTTYPHIEVTARYLGPDKAHLTIGDIAQASFWTDSSAEYIVRRFPTTGVNLKGTGQPSAPEDIFHRYFRSLYSSARDASGTAFTTMSSLYESHAYDSSHSPAYGAVIRLFKNKVD